MRRLLITCLLSLAAFAQDPSAIGGSQGAQQVFNGFLYANAFGTWSVPQGDVGQFTWSNPHVCENPTGVTFNLFSVGLPIKIIDADVTKNETTTITAVVKTGFQCSIVTAPLTFSHFSFRIVSGTLGLQEALNYAIQRNLNTTVFLTNAWTMMGGTTGMITSAAGNANIGIADERSPLHKAYAWNGSAYIQQGLGGFGITSIDAIPIGGFVPSTGAFTTLSASNETTSNLPVVNAMAYGNCLTGTFDQTCIQGAINHASTGYHIVVPDGTYNISALSQITGKDHLWLEMSKGAVLNVLAGLGSNAPLNVFGASTDILITGGKVVGNNIANVGVLIDSAGVSGGPQRVTVRGTEVTGTTSVGIYAHNNRPASSYDVKDITVDGVYVHDQANASTASGGVACLGVDGFTLKNSVIKNIFPGDAVQGGDCVNVKWEGNTITGFTQYVPFFVGSGLHCVFCSDITIENNHVDNTGFESQSGAAIWFDTVKGGTIANNSGLSNTSVGIRVELPFSNTVHDNHIFNTKGVGINMVGRTEYVQRNPLDSTTGLTPGSNVVLSTDTVDKQEGTASLVATLGAGFTTGTVFLQDLGAQTNWAACNTSSNCPLWNIWVKSSVTTSFGQLQLQVSAQPALGPYLLTYNLPLIEANTWVRLTDLFPQQEHWSLIYNQLRTWGIVATTSGLANAVLKFDDFGNSSPHQSLDVHDNTIVDAQGLSLSIFDSMTNFEVSHNHIYEPAWNRTSAGAQVVGMEIFSGNTGELQTPSITNGSIHDNDFYQTPNLVVTGINRGIYAALAGGTCDRIRVYHNQIFNYANPIFGFAAADPGGAVCTNSTELNNYNQGSTMAESVSPVLFTGGIGGAVTIFNPTNNQLTIKDTGTGNNVSYTLGAQDDGTGGVNIALDGNPVATHGVSFRLCRGTNTTGGCTFSLFQGNNSTNTLFTVNNTGRGQFAGGIQASSTSSTISGHFTNIATLTYTAIAAQTCQEQTLTVTGATTGKPANASPVSTLGNVNLSWSAWVSGSNTVSVRVCNPTVGSITPNAVSWQAWVVQ